MRAVISFANTPFYREKMKRLQESVEAQGIKFIGYTSCEEVGCKPHSEVPYQFKPYAIDRARKAGVTSLLWLDSPIVAIQNITPVFEYIEKNGYLFFDNIGHPLGKWCNDKTLLHFDILRQDAMNIKQVMACAQGWHFNDLSDTKDTGIFTRLSLFEFYKDLSDSLYPGPWANHRHDQAVLSCLIYKYKWNIENGHETFFMYEHFKDVPGWKIADSVCLISR